MTSEERRKQFARKPCKCLVCGKVIGDDEIYCEEHYEEYTAKDNKKLREADKEFFVRLAAGALKQVADDYVEYVNTLRRDPFNQYAKDQIRKIEQWMRGKYLDQVAVLDDDGNKVFTDLQYNDEFRKWTMSIVDPGAAIKSFRIQARDKWNEKLGEHIEKKAAEMVREVKPKVEAQASDIEKMQAKILELSRRIEEMEKTNAENIEQN